MTHEVMAKIPLLTYVLKYKHTTVLTTNMLGNLGHNMVLLLRSLIINDISDDQQLMGLCSNATVKRTFRYKGRLK